MIHPGTARALAVGLALAAAALMACERSAVQPPAGGSPLVVRVHDLRPDGYGRGPVAALSDRPIALGVFAGWYGQAELALQAVSPAAEPDRAYLAVATTTACRVPTGVEVRRSGTDLQVRFTGGTDHPECARPYGPEAVLSLAAADVAGVLTVDGRAPVAPTGPGRLTGLHPLGGAMITGAKVAELGIEGGATELAAALATSASPDALAALRRPVPAGFRAFAFVLTGCPAAAAVLLVNESWIDAAPIGGDARCDEPEFSLATFEVPADRVPPRALPGRR